MARNKSRKWGHTIDRATDASGRAMTTATALATATGTETATEFLTKRPQTPPDSLVV